MIQLKNIQPFAQGGRRLCYVHPKKPNRCIKICRPDRLPHQLKQEDPWYKQFRSSDYYDENVKDFNLLKELHQRIGRKARKHLPKTGKLIETNLGQGLVTELIRNHDGTISMSAKEYVYRNGITDELQSAAEKLRRFLIKNRVYFRDPFPHNVSVKQKKNGKLQLKIIDGLGKARAQTLPLLTKQRKIDQLERKYKKLIRGLNRANANRPKGIPHGGNGILSFSGDHS